MTALARPANLREKSKDSPDARSGSPDVTSGDGQPIGGSPAEDERVFSVCLWALRRLFMLRKADKAKIIDGLADRFRRQRVSIFTDIRGISVAKLSQFRRILRAFGAEFKVTKKTLLARALESAATASGGGIEPKALEGEIGVIFGYGDPTAPAKAAAKFAKENETFKVLKGLLGERILEARDVLAIAKLPPREQLLAQLAMVMNAPIRGLANALQGNIRNLVVVINKIAMSKKQ